MWTERLNTSICLCVPVCREVTKAVSLCGCCRCSLVIKHVLSFALITVGRSLPTHTRARHMWLLRGGHGLL